jgi:pyrimidine deaminase RibD-like protein
MSDQPTLDDRQHAIEFQKMLEAWRPLRAASRTSIHTLARYEPADDQTHQARAILDALRAHGRPTARFVASQCGSSESRAVLWWVNAPLADNFALDDESATRFDDINLIVDNALLQVEAATASERRFMELAIEEARKSVAEDERPHPKVGAVVVKDGKVIATAHRGEMALGDHAEYTVLEKKLKDESVAGATVYATLEPCTRRGANRTPCAQRLIDRKVKRVVIGMLDPNPNICGKGQRLLQSRGIQVDHFPHELVMQLEEMNREFTKTQEAAAVPPAPSSAAPPPDRAAELREQEFSKWHEKRLDALGAIYNAFCDYLGFLRAALYVKHSGMNLDPMHTFWDVIERQMVYLDEEIAQKVQRYQGELLLFWNWAQESLGKEGEAARQKIQERLDTEIPAYLPRLRQDINEVVDRKAWRDERRRQAGPQLHTLLDRIKREARNFENLRDGTPPFSEYTEVTPFELLERDLKPVSDLPEYRRLVEELLAEITRVQAMPRGQKDVTVFLPMIERLEKTLEVDVKGYPKTK